MLFVPFHVLIRGRARCAPAHATGRRRGRRRRTARFRTSTGGATGRLRKCERRHKGEARSQSDYGMFHGHFLLVK
jgi:hypothetical protein